MVAVQDAHVLLIDDDADVAESTAGVLRSAGLGVHAAPGVEYARQLCDVLVFDAVVLDHHLMEVDSRDFLAETPGTGLAVIVSAAVPDDLADVKRRLGDRVFAVKSKPCSPPALIATVEAAIAETRRRRQPD